MKKNIAVIFGGESTEHDISVLTGIQVANALDTQKYNLIAIYISNDGEWFCGEKLLDVKFYAKFDKRLVKSASILPCDNYLYIKKFGKYRTYKKIDCAILACHGKNGEDGTLQGLLELAHIPYSSSGVFASSVCLDKQKMKEIFKANRIPVCEYTTITKTQFQNQKCELEKTKFPVVVKPNTLGSSIGIAICNDLQSLNNALKTAFCFDNVALIEKCIQNLKEVNISVLGDEKNCWLSVTEQPNSNGFLSFEKKYLGPKTKFPTGTKNNFGTKNGMQNLDRLIPAKITNAQQKKIESLAKKIFEVTKSKGVVRIDFMIDTQKNKIYANEINSIPGSFAFYLWQKSGIEFDKLLDKLIQISVNQFNSQNQLTTKFNSSVLLQQLNTTK